MIADPYHTSHKVNVEAIMNARRTTKMVDHRVTRVISALSDHAGKDAELCSILRHDMLNLISVMHLRVQMMRKKGTLPEADCAVMMEAIHRMEMLIDDWRAVSQTATTSHVDQGAMNLITVVRNLVESNRPQAALKNQTFSLKVDAESAILVGNLSELQRAIDNLIGNAIKYTGDGGKINVIVQVSDHYVIIRIEDNGIGIPPTEIHRIFEPRYRASNALEHAIAGSGLGLAQVKSALEHHDGIVRVESQPGNGTHFEIQLPLAVNIILPGQSLQ
jgi:signal transduction histidine kinase